MLRIAAGLALVSTITTATLAQDLVIRGGARFDPVAGAMVRSGAIVVRDGRIAEVLAEDADLARLGAEAIVVEADSRFVIPGLIDLHVHVAAPGTGMAAPLRIDPYDQLSSHLRCGTTAVLDLHADENSIFELRERVASDPFAARLFSVGAAFTAAGGHGTQFGFAANVVADPSTVERVFDAFLDQRPDGVKLVIEHGGWIDVLPELPTLDEETVASVAAHGRAAGLPVFAHVWTLEEAKTAVRGGATALVHGVFTDPVDDELIALMKERGVAYVPTLAVMIAPRRIHEGGKPFDHELGRAALAPAVLGACCRKDPRASPPRFALGFEHEGGPEGLWLANLRRMADAGVVIGAGTDAGNPQTPHGPSLVFELETYVAAGMTPTAALLAATRSAATILGRAADLGSLEVGKLADIVLLGADPTADVSALRDVRGVVRGGRVVDLALLERRIADPALAATTQAIAAGDDLTLADFASDAASRFGGRFVASSDAVLGGGSRATATVGGGTLRIDGALAAGGRFGAFAGALLRFDPGGKRRVDATAATGIELRLRGSPRTAYLTLHRAAVADFNVFAAPVEITAEWRDVVVPFAAFAQIGLGARVAAGTADVTGIALEARSLPGAPEAEFWFEIDRVGFSAAVPDAGGPR
jgi:imidazolonepropionase-like amidohydrolase